MPKFQHLNDHLLGANVFLFTQPGVPGEERALETGIRMQSTEDLRWARRDIKTVGLMAQVFAKQIAKQHGADEALLIKDGYVTEGGSSSFFIIKGNTVITRPLSKDIPPGVTRRALMQILEQQAIVVDERLFTLDDALAADEAFVTGASTYFYAVVNIDGHAIGTGKPGRLVKQLQRHYLDHIEANAI